MDESCDHEWKLVDDSFDHEFGIELIVYWQCPHCDATKPFDYSDCYEGDD